MPRTPPAPRDEHRLEFLDQAALRLLRATGRKQLMQSLWVYEHPVDMAGLRTFHERFSDSIGNRLVESSRLPFGRPRWVRPHGPPPPMTVGEPRPRAELLDWADGLARRALDPEHGPPWRLSVQPFTDGSTGVSMLGSHVTGDGVGALMAVYAAITDTRRAVPYETAGTRGTRVGVESDLRQAVSDLPRTLRAARLASRVALDTARARRGGPPVPSGTTPAPADRDRTVPLATAAVVVPVAEWDARARELKGNTYALVAAVTARLGERLGRARPTDGMVTLVMAVNQRTSLEDDRAIAMAFARACVDPRDMTADLSSTRVTLRESRRALRDEPDSMAPLLPLVPWLPTAALRRIPELLFAEADDLPISCSNLGDLVPDLARVDGTPAEHVIVRGLDSDVSLDDLRRANGHLVVVSGRVGEEISIAVESWQMGADNSRDRLRALVDASLADFGLRGRQL